ncbi:MAG: holo-ACP synthase [Rickettsiales bacterium]|nr:holo-ACP synthase [Rickettsiales bacterium]
MIFGIGTDLVDTRRVERMRKRFADRFEDRFFTEEERNNAHAQVNPLPRFAKYIAAKEACYKALRAEPNSGIGWKDMVVSYEENGRPIMTLSGNALQHITRQYSKGEFYKIHVSLSDELPYACAQVVIEIVPMANS